MLAHCNRLIIGHLNPAGMLACILPRPIRKKRLYTEPKKRRELCERVGGKVVEKIERKKMPNGKVLERVKEEVEGSKPHPLPDFILDDGAFMEDFYKRLSQISADNECRSPVEW